MIKKYKTYYADISSTGYVVGKFGAEVRTDITGYTFNGLVSGSGYTSAPAWFGTGGALPYDIWWVIDTPLSALDGIADYKFSYTLNYGGDSVEYLVELNVQQYSPIQITSNCNTKVIMWLNRQGGWSVFPFTGVTTFEVEIPEATFYQNSDYVRYVAERKGVAQAELLTTGDIPQSALDYMESLKYTTQAYYLKGYGTSEQEAIPLIIEADSFVKRKTRDKIFDVSVRIIYAQEIVMQNG